MLCLANYGNGPLLIGKSQSDKNQEISATKSRQSEGAPGAGTVKHRNQRALQAREWSNTTSAPAAPASEAHKALQSTTGTNWKAHGKVSTARNKMSDGNNQEIPGGNGSANS